MAWFVVIVHVSAALGAGCRHSYGFGFIVDFQRCFRFDMERRGLFNAATVDCDACYVRAFGIASLCRDRNDLDYWGECSFCV